jgi:hypothetical protein
MIQAHIKGFLAYRARKKKMQAIAKIQRFLKQKYIRNIYLKILSAIIFIQAVYRGYRGRKYAKTLLPRDVIARHLSKKRW